MTTYTGPSQVYLVYWPYSLSSMTWLRKYEFVYTITYRRLWCADRKYSCRRGQIWDDVFGWYCEWDSLTLIVSFDTFHDWIITTWTQRRFWCLYNHSQEIIFMLGTEEVHIDLVSVIVYSLRLGCLWTWALLIPARCHVYISFNEMHFEKVICEMDSDVR